MSASPVYDVLASSTLMHDVESAFVQATGLSVQLVPSSRPSEGSQLQQRENPFCSLMSSFKESCEACQRVHTELQQRVVENLVPQVTLCFTGLVEFAVPVVAAGQHIATLLGGQVLQSKPTQTQVAQLIHQLHAWEISYDPQQIETAFLQTRVVPQEQFEAGLQLLRFLARFVGEDADRGLLVAHDQDQPCIVKAKGFISAHATEALRSHDVAEYLHVSTHYFCKFFKKETGMGFSEFLARLRVAMAKDLINNSSLSINEAAHRVGFGSLSQFNRVFHRYAGSSPREFRASIRQAHFF